jgi:hypothetical protein
MTCGPTQQRPTAMAARASGACAAGASQFSVFQLSSVPSQSSSSLTVAPWLSTMSVVQRGARIVNFTANQPVHGRIRSMSVGSVARAGHEVHGPRNELKRWFSKE